MWIYWIRLYDSKFQASCVMQRMEHDYWMYGMEYPQEIEIYKSKRGRYGVRFMVSKR